MYHFFGLGLDYKPVLHKQLFEMLYFSQGSFTHTDLYEMPVYLRTFYYRELSKQLKTEKDAMDKGSNSNNTGRPNIPSWAKSSKE